MTIPTLVSISKIVSGVLVLSVLIGSSSVAHADQRAAEGHPQLTVGGPVATGIRTVINVVNDPALFGDAVVGQRPVEGLPRAPTWVGPEFQKPQYQTTLLELTF